MRRARRARSGRSAVLTVAALAAVTAAGGLAAGLHRSEGATTSATTATAADTPALQLVAAVQTSAQTSFRFSVTSGGKSVEFGKEKPIRQRTYTGAYDPPNPATLVPGE